MIHKALGEHKHGNREGGTGGGWPDFAKGIKLVYSISFYAGHAYLDVAVLMRCLDGYTQFQTPQHEFLDPPPESSGQGGGGASIGGQMFYYDSGNRILYMNHTRLLETDKSNIVLLEDEASRSPRIVATDHVNEYLGVVDRVTESMHERNLKLIHRLDELVRTSSTVQAFVGL